MSHSKESICNSALGLLGKPPLVTNADQPQQYANADAAVRAYEERIGRVLRSHDWNFAETLVQLSADPTPPLFGFRFRYLLPGDVAKVWGPHPDYHARDAKWAVRAGYIETDIAAPLNLIYTRRETDPSKFDDAFAEALAMEIASKIAVKVLGSVEAASEFRKEAADDVRDAGSLSNQENPPKREDEGTWTTRRRTG